MFSLSKFFSETFEISASGHQVKARPRIECKDGFSMSVQASYAHNCSPKEDLESGLYSEVEVSFISIEEELLLPYIEVNWDIPTKCLYNLVPVEIVDKVIEKHGGVV